MSLLSGKRGKIATAAVASVGSRPPAEMDGPARVFVLALAIIALATVRAHVPSRDNILRIQLWDAEGLSRVPITTPVPTTTSAPVTTSSTIRPKKLRVDVNSLYDAMLQEAHGGGFGRFTRHKVRHKRRRARQVGTDLPWRFHSGDQLVNVAVFDDDVSWPDIEGAPVNASAVSEVQEARDVAPPMTLRQPQDEVNTEGKHSLT